MRHCFIVFVLLVLNSCANIGTLTGGQEDKTPPKPLKDNISITNFNTKTIEIEFDEFIEVNNSAENIKLYPEHTTLSVSTAKKKLIIKLDSALKPNTTYNLQINNGVKDVNAGNLYSKNYLFSTGNILDTGILSINISNYKSFKNLKIAILSDLPGDSLRQFKSNYSYAIKSGLNQFYGLKNIKYNIYAFTDNNSDNKPDWYQPINFILNAAIDTTYNLEIIDWNNKFRIKSIVTDGEYSKVYYSHTNYYQYELREIFGDQLENAEYYNEDSAVIKNLKFQFPTDTIKKIDYLSDLQAIILNNIQYIKMKNQTYLIFNKPQVYQEYQNFMKIYRDKTIYTSAPSKMLLYVPRLERLDSVDLKKVPILDHAKLAYLKIEIDDQYKQLYDIRIKKDDKIIVNLFDYRNCDFYLEPGQYKVEIFKRSYTNIFNPFEYKNFNAPIYAKDLILKASWDEILSIKLK